MGYDKDTGYYSLREILGYNAKYNAVLSERGPGKSYGTKLFLMDRTDETAMCVYRDVPDMMSAIGSWIEPLIKEGYSRSDFKMLGGKDSGYVLTYDEEPKIWFRAITQVTHIKEEYFPDNMNWVWWDEFIPLKQKKLAGISSESDALRTIVKTIEHDTIKSREEKGLKPVRVLMYANPFTWDNPILSDFRINPFMGFGVHRAGPGVAFEMLKPIEKKGDEAEDWLGDEVHRNMGWAEELSFVEPIPKGVHPEMSVRLGERYFTVYARNGVKWVKEAKKHSKVEIRREGGKVVKLRFGSLDGLKDDEICIDKSMLGKKLKEDRYRGVYRFPDLNVKFNWLNGLNESF